MYCTCRTQRVELNGSGQSSPDDVVCGNIEISALNCYSRDKIWLTITYVHFNFTSSLNSQLLPTLKIPVNISTLYILFHIPQMLKVMNANVIQCYIDDIIMYITTMNIVIISISTHLIPCSPLMSLLVNSTLVLRCCST